MNDDFCPSRIEQGLKDRATVLGCLASGDSLPAIRDEGIRAALLPPPWRGEDRGAVFDRVRPGERVCIVVSDQTRGTAIDRVLPILLEELTKRGCDERDFFFLFATGIHRAPTVEETRRILGPAVADRFAGRIHAHDPDDDANLVKTGVTSRGHSVRLNRRAVEADRLILTGAAGYHYHAGFSGGRKSLVPGLASRDTIAHDHRLTLDPDRDDIHPRVQPGRLDGNPVAEEMMEGARTRPPDFIVNTVLGPAGELVGVFCGEMDAAHRAACRLVERTQRVEIGRPADLVIASAGTAANWIQSHKALFNAHRAMRAGGRVVLEAPCPEGLGNERFRYWIRKPAVAELVRELRASVEVYGQTALSTRVRGAAAILVTRMSEADVKDLGIRTAPTVEAAIEIAIRELSGPGRPKPTCYLMPGAMHTVPFGRAAQ